MNIILTTRCNKGCSFCFAKDKNKTAEDISLENIQKIFEFAKSSNPIPQIKLLGGEPTLHPNIKDIIKLLAKNNLYYGLISNGLYEDLELNNLLKNSLEQGFLISILFNITELNTASRKNIFKNNYDYFVKSFRENSNFNLACALTLNRRKKVNEELDYLKWLIDNYEIHILRVSLDFLGNNSEDEYFINNKEYGEKILRIYELAAAKQIIVTGDCIAYPCMFDKYISRKKILRLIENMRFKCLEDCIPFDITPDLKFFHCYPANNFSGGNLLDFNNYQEAIRDLQFRKNVLMQSREIPEICRNCVYYQEKLCYSLCLGCTKLDSTVLQPVS